MFTIKRGKIFKKISTWTKTMAPHEHRSKHMQINHAVAHMIVLSLCLLSSRKTSVLGDDKSYRQNSFQVFWNVPTFMCKPFNVNFDELARYGIVQNSQDEFRGERILILYDPGQFPSLNEEGKVEKNRGVPQLGDLSKHLTSMERLIDKLIPDKQFDGLGVLDFESWRPVWKQNWGSLLMYREFSRTVEKKKHPNWSKDRIENEAEERFQTAGRQFMEQTLDLVRRMRPAGQWGYYAFPYCFNFTPKNMQPDCPPEIRQENNNIQWLFDGSDSLFPSIYLSKHKLNEDQRRQFVEGRLNEAVRVARNSRKRQTPSMYPYIWYRYYDDNDFITKNDMINSLKIAKRHQMGGAIIWGSSSDLNTKEKCENFARYLENELGPIIQSITSSPNNVMSDYNEPSNKTLMSYIPFYNSVLLP